MRGHAGTGRRGASPPCPGSPLKRRLTFGAEEVSKDEGLGWLPLACRVAHNAWEFDSWHYGEWLRRENHRVDAPKQLGIAYEMLSESGARGVRGTRAA